MKCLSTVDFCHMHQFSQICYAVLMLHAYTMFKPALSDI